MAAAMATAFAGSAAALPISISGTHDRGEIKSTCEKTGGGWFSNLDGYGCINPNCDGKGGACAVKCENDGKCTGTVPQIKGVPAPRSLDGILKQKSR